MRPITLAALLFPLAACGSDGGSSPSGNIPAAVSSVTAAVNGGQIQLDWTAVPGATSYTVYMASNAGVTRQNVGSLPGNMTHAGLNLSFDHPPGLNANTTYYFVVTAKNAAGESIESCEVSAQEASATGGTC